MHISSDSLFSKILKKPSIVQKKMISHMKTKVFHQLWPNNPNAPGPTTSGGFIEVNNCLIWCSTAHKVAGSTLVPPSLLNWSTVHCFYVSIYLFTLTLVVHFACFDTWVLELLLQIKAGFFPCIFSCKNFWPRQELLAPITLLSCLGSSIDCVKGQLISKANFLVLIWTKKWDNFFWFLP